MESMPCQMSSQNGLDHECRNQQYQHNHDRLDAQCNQGHHELSEHHIQQRDLMLST